MMNNPIGNVFDDEQSKQNSFEFCSENSITFISDEDEIYTGSVYNGTSRSAVEEQEANTHALWSSSKVKVILFLLKEYKGMVIK